MQRDVLGNREVEDESAALAILRDVAETVVEVFAGTSARDVDACQLDRPGRRSSEASDGVHEFGLAVSVDAGDADDLSACTVERHAPHLLDASVVTDSQVLDPEQRLTDSTGLFSTRSSTSRPTMSRASRSSVAPAAGTVSTFLPSQDRDSVGDLEHFVQLVGDEDDRHPLALEAREDAEELAASCGVSTAVGSSRIKMSARR